MPYRTTEAEPTFQTLRDPACNRIPGGRPFPTALDPFTCNRYECAEFAQECVNLDVRYIGLRCGAAPHHIRAVAEAIGRITPASRYSPDMSKHASLEAMRRFRSGTGNGPRSDCRRTVAAANAAETIQESGWPSRRVRAPQAAILATPGFCVLLSKLPRVVVLAFRVLRGDSPGR
jgi:hypothetical protein